MDGTAMAIPSTLSVGPTTPTGRFPSWITPKIPRIGQKEGFPQGIRGQPTPLALPGIWSWDPKEGKSLEVGLTAASQKGGNYTK